MNIDRSWMWRRLDDNGFLLDEFVTKVDQEFLNFSFDSPRSMNNRQIKYPCSKCGNTKFLNRSDAHLHIVKNGFTRGYNIWYAHGESLNTRDDVRGSSSTPQVETSRYRTMVMDAISPEFSSGFMCDEQLPNPEAQKFFNLLKDADEPLWDGCKNHTKLSTVAQLLSIKSEYNLPEAYYDRLMLTIKNMLSEDEKLPDNFYTTKKHLSTLGLGLVRQYLRDLKMNIVENKVKILYHMDVEGDPIMELRSQIIQLRYWWDNLTDEEMKKEQLGREPDMKDMIDRGPYWLNNQLWNELVQKIILEYGLRVGARLDGMGRAILPSSTQYDALLSPPGGTLAVHSDPQNPVEFHHNRSSTLFEQPRRRRRPKDSPLESIMDASLPPPAPA
ncbi:hypothetical protein Salat_0676900 [Sesamum alatum]|uniref:Transposase-associated domain-containing protein n=1 Tax=Sesamum alatum TaxID=300844 RepID=A0AAE1YSD7_9LAMI|nr:hypothetical protein Salat_0676900 [Sesamum alatum]